MYCTMWFSKSVPIKLLNRKIIRITLSQGLYRISSVVSCGACCFRCSNSSGNFCNAFPNKIKERRSCIPWIEKNLTGIYSHPL